MELRLTFREKSPTICWQKQLRDKFNLEGVPPVPHLEVNKAMVRKITNRQAAQIIKRYEWLGTMGAGVETSYGIFFGMFCAGVTTFSNGGATPALAKTFGIPCKQLRYLTRGANTHWSPKYANSKLIAMSLRLEAKHGKLAIAFSDSDAGEIGTVYQATNWIYIGKGTGWFQWVSAQGKIWSSNSFTKRASTQNITTTELATALIKEGWVKQKANPKGRYVYVLDRTDKRLIDKVEAMRQPYPKRGTGETDNAAHSHAQIEGASPIVPLFNHGS